MATEIEVANRALAICGEQAISSLDDSTKAARLLRSQLPLTAEALLRSHFWNFAGARAALAADAVAPDFGWDNRYKLPNDFLAMRRLYEMDYAYTVEGGFILSDYGPPLNIVYTKTVPYGAWDALAIDALAGRMAVIVSIPLSGSREVRREAQAYYDLAISEARRANAIEHSTHEMDADVWLRARFQGI